MRKEKNQIIIANVSCFTEKNDLKIFKKYSWLLVLSLLIISLSSFDILSEKKEMNENTIECIEPQKKELQESNDIVNTFLEYIPGLREYLFRFKKTDLKKTC